MVWRHQQVYNKITIKHAFTCVKVWTGTPDRTHWGMGYNLDKMPWKLMLCLLVSSLCLFAFVTDWRKSELTIKKSTHTKTTVLQQATIQHSSYLFELKMITTGAALLEFWRGSDSCRCAAFQFWSLLHRVGRLVHLLLVHLLLLHLLPPLLETWPARVPAAQSAAATWTQMRFFKCKATTEAD